MNVFVFLGLEKKAVKAVLVGLKDVVYNQLKEHGSSILHGFAKFTVKNRPASKARKGRRVSVVGPFTHHIMGFPSDRLRSGILRWNFQINFRCPQFVECVEYSVWI